MITSRVFSCRKISWILIEFLLNTILQDPNHVKLTSVWVIEWLSVEHVKTENPYLHFCFSFSQTLHTPIVSIAPSCLYFNTLRPRQNGRHFADNIFKCIILNENVWILIRISMKFISKGPINNIQALVQIMAWRRPSAKPLSEPMMVNLTTHMRHSASMCWHGLSQEKTCLWNVSGNVRQYGWKPCFNTMQMGPGIHFIDVFFMPII